MVATSFSASAPGNLMVLGEYAVTQGHPALVWAIDQCIRVQLTPRNDNTIHIQSTLGNFKTTLDDFSSQAPFQFVLSAIQLFKTQLPYGFDLTIHSEFESGIGLSSSAAVTVATLRVLHAFLSQKISNEALLEEAICVLHDVQGTGSGADMAASIYEKFIYFENGRVIKQFNTTPPFFAIYSGTKDNTAGSLKRVDLSQHEDVLQKTTVLTEKSVSAIEAQDWTLLGKYLNDAQTCMTLLGVSTPALENIIKTCHEKPGVLGAKISGSGFGDCVIGLGTPPKLINTVIPREPS